MEGPSGSQRSAAEAEAGSVQELGSSLENIDQALSVGVSATWTCYLIVESRWERRAGWSSSMTGAMRTW
jgi:hypothetical protein